VPPENFIVQECLASHRGVDLFYVTLICFIRRNSMASLITPIPAEYAAHIVECHDNFYWIDTETGFLAEGSAFRLED
jgi:hypothetical protein